MFGGTMWTCADHSPLHSENPCPNPRAAIPIFPRNAARLSPGGYPGRKLRLGAEFFLELLMGLLARPARLDGSGESFQLGARRMIGEVVLDLFG